MEKRKWQLKDITTLKKARQCVEEGGLEKVRGVSRKYAGRSTKAILEKADASGFMQLSTGNGEGILLTTDEVELIPETIVRSKSDMAVLNRFKQSLEPARALSLRQIYNKIRRTRKGQGEEWNLSYPEWIDVWKSTLVRDEYGDYVPAITRRYRKGICMRRLDRQKPWSIDNVAIGTKGKLGRILSKPPKEVIETWLH